MEYSLAKHSFIQCRKSFFTLISEVRSSEIQLNEIERTHLQLLYSKWSSANFLNSDLQMFFDMKEDHKILDNRLKHTKGWSEYMEASDLFRLQIMMTIYEN